MRTLVLAVLLALTSPIPALAQGIIIPRPRPCPPPRECIPQGAEVVRTRSDVRVELVGRVLRFEVEERFRNRGGMVGEADFLFPLPKGAAFQDLKLSIDGEMVAGETMDAAEARRIYEEIVRQQRDPALVEWMGHGLLRTRIFPIQPGEERRIVVRFQMVAEREGDFLRVDYFRGTRAQGSLTLTYPATSEFGRAYSPTHSVDFTERGGRRVARVEGDAADVTVLIPSRRGTAAAIGAVAHAPGRDDGFVLLTVAPPVGDAAQPAPRDIVFVVDVSGSMSGVKMEQARAAGRALLATLRPADRFRIIDFASDVRTFRDDAVFATSENLAAARRYIDRLEASGGTNISGALDEALRADSWDSRGGEGRLGFVLFVTDGAPTVGEREPHRIADRVRRLRGDRRVFTFGVGSDVNTQVIEQLAIEGAGTAHFVRPDESVEHPVGVVAARLRDPILADARITVEGDAIRLNRLLPAQQLDIFAGQDLVVLARYSGSGRARVTVTGRTPRGADGGAPRHVRWSTDVTLPDRERDNAFVARLWATQRVGWLAAEKRRANGPTREIDEEIRELGERFGIPTEFTSYFVKEPGMVVGNPRTVRPGPLNAPVQAQARRDGSGGGAAAAPSAADASFESGRMAARQRTATSLATANEAADLAAEQSAGIQRVGPRMFTLVDGRWTDSRHTENSRTVHVRLFSSAYFQLLDEIPELRQYVALAERVLIAGRGLSLEVGPDGAERLSTEDVRALRAALDDQDRR